MKEKDKGMGEQTCLKICDAYQWNAIALLGELGLHRPRTNG